MGTLPRCCKIWLKGSHVGSQMFVCHDLLTLTLLFGFSCELLETLTSSGLRENNSRTTLETKSLVLVELLRHVQLVTRSCEGLCENYCGEEECRT